MVEDEEGGGGGRKEEEKTEKEEEGEDERGEGGRRKRERVWPQTLTFIQFLETTRAKQLCAAARGSHHPEQCFPISRGTSEALLPAAGALAILLCL